MRKIILFTLLILPLAVESGPFPKEMGIILGSRVNMRTAPSLKAKKIISLNELSRIFILGKTGTKTRVAKMDDFWYRVKTDTGKIGYIFGAYLFPLDELFQKKWTTGSPSGDTEIEFIFKRDGTYTVKYTYPYGSPGVYSGKEEGTYAIKGQEIARTIVKATQERGTSPGKAHSLYFFRVNGVACLSFEKYKVGTEVNYAVDENLIRPMGR